MIIAFIGSLLSNLTCKVRFLLYSEPHDCLPTGGNRFIEDIEMMIGKKSCMFWMWWRLCWFFITPVLLMVRAHDWIALVVQNSVT